MREINWLPVGYFLLHSAGPLPKPMFMLEFDEQYLSLIYEIFAPYQHQYSIFIHPELEDEYLAHTQYAIWLGEVLALRLEYLET